MTNEQKQQLRYEESLEILEELHAAIVLILAAGLFPEKSPMEIIHDCIQESARVDKLPEEEKRKMIQEQDEVLGKLAEQMGIDLNSAVTMQEQDDPFDQEFDEIVTPTAKKNKKPLLN